MATSASKNKALLAGHTNSNRNLRTGDYCGHAEHGRVCIINIDNERVVVRDHNHAVHAVERCALWRI
jgi:hypothetical protein